MQVADAMIRLDGFHTRIGTVLARARAAHVDPQDDRALLAQLRWELLRLLREYQLFKHGELFDPMLRSPDASRRHRAAMLKTRCEEVAAAVNDHARRWTLAGAANGSDYVAQSRALMARIAEHLVRERAGIVDLLDGVQRTRHA